MKRIAVAERKHDAPDEQFRLRVLAADVPHVLAEIHDASE